MQQLCTTASRMGSAASPARRNGPGGPWGVLCGAPDTNVSLLCLEEYVDHRHGEEKDRRLGETSPLRNSEAPGRHPVLEDLIWELFRQHDLSGNEMFEEVDLIRLNEKIAEVHHGKDANFKEVRDKYTELYRTKLDADGKPVDFARFRTYMIELLDELDRDEEAQVMMLEQFIAEAYTARQAIDFPATASEVGSICSTRDRSTPTTGFPDDTVDFPPDAIDIMSTSSQTGPL